MQRLYSMFPADAAGAGLLILRLYVATPFLLELVTAGTGEPMGRTLSLVALSACLCLGAFTPAACMLSLASGITWTDGPIGLTPELLHAAVSVSLLLLGPGAYSVDARRYGRRRVLLRFH